MSWGIINHECRWLYASSNTFICQLPEPFATFCILERSALRCEMNSLVCRHCTDKMQVGPFRAWHNNWSSGTNLCLSLSSFTVKVEVGFIYPDDSSSCKLGFKELRQVQYTFFLVIVVIHSVDNRSYFFNAIYIWYSLVRFYF